MGYAKSLESAECFESEDSKYSNKDFVALGPTTHHLTGVATGNYNATLSV